MDATRMASATFCACWHEDCPPTVRRLLPLADDYRNTSGALPWGSGLVAAVECNLR